MAHTRNNKCPRCRCSYGSATHAKKCRGLSGQSLRAWRGQRSALRRSSRSMARATRFAFASSPASASFYDDARHKADQQTQPEVQ